jgi:PTH2 family peptidyl-tRNA hydrolase
MDTKQVIVLRKDLNMRKGKCVAQGCHASIAVLTQEQLRLHYPSPEMADWLNGLQTKVCVSVNSEQELLDLYQRALAAGIPCSLITDAGKTEFGGVPTKTCCAIGPAEVAIIDTITGTLSLL